MGTSKNFQVRAALFENVESGTIWLQGVDGFNGRSLVSVSNEETGAKIWVEALVIDRNFRQVYQQSEKTRELPLQSEPAIVINQWYRDQLRIPETGDRVHLNVEVRKGLAPWRMYKAAAQHPQASVRLANYLGVIGLLLGVIGLFLGLLSLK